MGREGRLVAAKLLIDTDVHIEGEEAVCLIADVGKRIVIRHIEQVQRWQLLLAHVLVLAAY